MKNKPRKRRPSRANNRANAWLQQASRGAIRTGESTGMNGRMPDLAAYAVHRVVQGSTPGGIFDRPDILDLLDGDHGAKAVHRFMISLISPKIGKELTNTWSGKPSDLKQKLETAAGAFPDSLNGFLFNAMISGAPKNRPGPRFVGYTLNRQLQETVKEERGKLIAETAQASPRERLYTPHITLFETMDQKLAEGLVKKLRGFLEVAAIPLDLGEAEVVPIANVQTRYQGVG